MFYTCIFFNLNIVDLWHCVNFYMYVFMWLRRWEKYSEKNSQGEKESTFALRNEDKKDQLQYSQKKL